MSTHSWNRVRGFFECSTTSNTTTLWESWCWSSGQVSWLDCRGWDLGRMDGRRADIGHILGHDIPCPFILSLFLIDDCWFSIKNNDPLVMKIVYICRYLWYCGPSLNSQERTILKYCKIDTAAMKKPFSAIIWLVQALFHSINTKQYS
jgi:hypothetical protein